MKPSGKQAARTAPAVPTLVVALVGCAVFLNVYTTQALLPELSREFQASSVAVAATVSATTLAMALCSPLVGLLADASGRKRLLVGALLLLAVPCLLIAQVLSLTALTGWRFLQGVLVPGVTVVAAAYIVEECDPRRVPSVLAAYIAGTVVGGFGGRFITGLVADLYDWRTAFYVIAVTNVLAAITVWLTLPRARRFVAQPIRESLPRLREHLGNPDLLAACAVGFGLLFALVGIFTFINFHLADPPYNLGPSALGSVFAVYLLGVVVTPPSGRLVSRFGHRRVLLGALGISSAGFLLTLLSPLPLIVLGLAIGSSGIFVAQATATGYAALSVQRGRSLASGLYNAVYYAGGAGGAVLVGLVFAHMDWPGAVMAVLSAQGVAAFVGSRTWHA